jgi:hypothetical protein
MLPIAYYFLQVILCSGLMMGYYWLVLRNKRFHQYNRFYLLVIALFAWIVPLIKIQWGHQVINEDPQMMRFLSIVADNNSQIEQTITTKGFRWNWDIVATGIYFTIAGILLLGMLRALYRLYYLLKENSCKNVGDVYLVLTQAKGTPFSFFRYIFWNEEIDIRSEAGKQILQHELTHVQQKHTFDKLFIQVMLIAGWFNPFFWLIKKEMDMIHEFIADKKAVNNGDTASLAQMLLTAAYPQQQFALTHPFFFSPIKRRLQMLTNNKNPRFSYIRRLVVLPLLAIVVVLFAFRNKEQRINKIISVETIAGSVMKDIHDNISELIETKKDPAAGNSGIGSPVEHIDGDLLTFSPDNAKEQQPLTLEKVKEMLAHGKSQKDEADNLTIAGKDDAVEFAEKKAGDRTALTIAQKPLQLTGIVDTVPPTEAIWVQGFKIGDTVIKNNNSIRINGASPLIVIDGIKGGTLNSIEPNDINSIDVLKGEMAMKKYGDEGKDGVIEISTKGNRKLADGRFYIESRPATVQTRSVPHNTVKGYKIFTDVEVPAEFPGGLIAWGKYLRRNLDKEVVAKHSGPPGKYTVVVSFIVDSTGTLSDVEAMNDPGYGTKEEAVSVIFKGPKWIPARQNGIAVNSIRKQSISFYVTDFKKPGTQVAPPVVTQTPVITATTVYLWPQIPAQFPGGDPAWRKYLERNLNLDLPVQKGAHPGTYIDTLNFMVDKTGRISNVRSVNDPGYGISAESERIIQKGPKWKPAIQNGLEVASLHVKTITFVISQE